MEYVVHNPPAPTVTLSKMGETEKSHGKFCQLTMCCCGCTLKTGSLIIASLEMV